MKSERRHELQHNALDEELGRIVAFLRDHGAKLAGAVLVVVAVVLLVLFFVQQEQAQLHNTVNSFERVIFRGFQLNPELPREEALQALAELMEQEESEWIAAQAGVQLGQVFARQSLLAEDPNEQQQATGRAKEYYEAVIARFPGQPVQVANARFGLAKLAEGAGDWETARQYYTDIVGMDLAGEPVLLRARQLLEANQLAELQQVPGEFLGVPTTAPADQAPQPGAAPAQPDAGAPMDITPPDWPQPNGATEREGGAQPTTQPTGIQP